MKKKIETTFIIFDTETTGVVKHKDRIIELALAAVKGRELLGFKEDLCKPADVKIKPAAAMTHSYTNAQIANKPPFEETEACKMIKESLEDKVNTYYVAHNAKFDTDMLEMEDVFLPEDKVIDTLKIARHILSGDLKGTPVEKYIWEEDETIPEMAKLQYYRYYFSKYFEDKEPEYMERFGVTYIQPHTALSDIIVLWILTDMIMEAFGLSADQMVELSKKPALETTMSFGKIFDPGTPYEEIVTATYMQYGKPKNGYDYLAWIIKEMKDINLDRAYSIRYYLAYGILNKSIPLSLEMNQFLVWGSIFVFTKEEITRAIEMIGSKEMFQKMLSGYENGTEAKISKLKETTKEEGADPRLINDLDDTVYMKKYYDKYRKGIFEEIFPSK